MNKGFAVFGAVTLAALASLSVSQGRTLTVSSFGLNQALIDKNVTRPFEAKCGCKIVYETGNNADRLAKLVARKDNPNVDVTLLGDASAKLAANQGLLEALDLKKLKNHARLYDFAKNPLGGNAGVAYTVYALGIAYRTDKIKTPIRSWQDLWRSDLAGRIALPNITTTQGPLFVNAVNKAWGGDEKNAEPAFKKLAEIKKNVVTFYNQSAQLTSLFAQDEVWVAPVGRFTWGNLLNTKKPLAWAVPKEGQPGVMNTVSIVKGSKNSDLAHQYIDFLISTEIQTAQANDLVDSPANKTVYVTPEKAAQLTFGFQQVKRLTFMDLGYTLSVRDAWIERWNREIAR